MTRLGAFLERRAWLDLLALVCAVPGARGAPPPRAAILIANARIFDGTSRSRTSIR